ncbi:LysM peptidoglycan-binding domain-containing protein [Streptomyces sp. RerS4]|uniref:LysM peptidoglycan-binding domain-containing protein n=1 Tax=Streptomyces sp. RerS4 TaxID=2942449 RepID=UPI00201C71EE|nr:LysM peptidoglycan-binding domain-containing protein [Streptomyces sp. RerS4]UQX01988.1 LysM peptidoglycan-binding domain-containing protein [Streptomyces sp. RerS4]
MGLFDFLKSEKKKEHEAAEKAKEQVEQQAQAAPAAPGTPGDLGGKYTDAASATKAAGERMAAPSAAPKIARTPTGPAGQPMAGRAPGPAQPTPGSAAHKAVPVPPTTKPAPAAKKRTYTVKAGDSLSMIARQELGNEGRWRELYAMNRGVIGSNPDLLRPGMVLTLPQ